MTNKSSSTFKSASQAPKYLQNAILSKSATTEYDLLNKFSSRVKEPDRDAAAELALITHADSVEKLEVVCQREAQIKDLGEK